MHVIIEAQFRAISNFFSYVYKGFKFSWKYCAHICVKNFQGYVLELHKKGSYFLPEILSRVRFCCLSLALKQAGHQKSLPILSNDSNKILHLRDPFMESICLN